jgi:excisionase family DNA binding protein
VSKPLDLDAIEAGAQGDLLALTRELREARSRLKAVEGLRGELRLHQGMIDPSSPEELLTAEQVAQRLQVHRNWVYEKGRLGLMPFHRISGNHLRYRWSEVLGSFPDRESKLSEGGHQRGPSGRGETGAGPA